MFKINPKRSLLKIFGIIVLVYLAVFCVLFIKLTVTKKYIYPINYKEEVFSSAEEFNLDPALVFSVIKAESNFDRQAVSKKGAIGLMQLKPSTAQSVAKQLGVTDFDLTEADINIRLGCCYLNYLINRFKNEKTALAAYNAGESRVNEWLKNTEYSDNGVTLKKIPFEETEKYIEKITESFSKYKKLYRNILDK